MIANSGVIFDSRRPSLLFVRGVGIGLIGVSLVSIFVLLQPIISSEVNYRFTQKPITKVNAESGFGELLARQQYVKTLAKRYGVDSEFSIYIPKIGAKAKVVPNVNSASEKDMKEKLKLGVAHAAGTSLPGNGGGTYLFAHSTDAPFNISQYNAVFYLLRDLVEKDEIYVFFNSEVYKYRVQEKHVVPGSNVSWLKDAKNGEERLILQTCWPPGTTWKRLIVVAEALGPLTN